MQTYRIKDWALHFENNRTRELKSMDWIPVPNKHDGLGFTELITAENGTAIYGAWHLILQVASKCPRRGTLVQSDGNPHTPRTIALKTRGDIKLIELAISVCVKIGWIEAIPQEGAGSPQEGAEKLSLDKSTTYKIPQEGAGSPQVARAGGTEVKGSTLLHTERPISETAPKSIQLKTKKEKQKAPYNAVSIWHDKFMSWRHTKPYVSGADRGVLQNMAMSIPEETLRKAIGEYLGDGMQKMYGWTVKSFCAKINTYLEKVDMTMHAAAVPEHATSKNGTSSEALMADFFGGPKA